MRTNSCFAGVFLVFDRFFAVAMITPFLYLSAARDSNVDAWLALSATAELAAKASTAGATGTVRTYSRRSRADCFLPLAIVTPCSANRLLWCAVSRRGQCTSRQ